MKRLLLAAAMLPLMTAPAGEARPYTASACQTVKCKERVKKKRAWRLCVKRHGAEVCTWRNRYRRRPAYARGWAYRTEECESGHNPRAHNPSGIYHGSMQFDLHTWRHAGGSGDPHTATIYEQRDRAIRLYLNGEGGRWPVCG